MRPTFPLVLNLVVVLTPPGCQSEWPVEKTSPLVEAAHQTYARYVRAMRGYAGEDPVPDEIPRHHWAKAISKLNPIKVYKHRVNIVVVQNVRDNVEEGKYICIPVSSYLPMDGVDGFTYKPNPLKGNRYHLKDGVFDYQRRIEY